MCMLCKIFAHRLSYASCIGREQLLSSNQMDEAKENKIDEIMLCKV